MDEAVDSAAATAEGDVGDVGDDLVGTGLMSNPKRSRMAMMHDQDYTAHDDAELHARPAKRPSIPDVSTDTNPTDHFDEEAADDDVAGTEFSAPARGEGGAEDAASAGGRDGASMGGSAGGRVAAGGEGRDEGSAEDAASVGARDGARSEGGTAHSAASGGARGDELADDELAAVGGGAIGGGTRGESDMHPVEQKILRRRPSPPLQAASESEAGAGAADAADAASQRHTANVTEGASPPPASALAPISASVSASVSADSDAAAAAPTRVLPASIRLQVGVNVQVVAGKYDGQRGAVIKGERDEN